MNYSVFCNFNDIFMTFYDFLKCVVDSQLISIMSNELRSRAKDDSDNESIASVASTAAPTISREGRKTDKKHFFEHQECVCSFWRRETANLL